MYDTTLRHWQEAIERHAAPELQVTCPCIGSNIIIYIISYSSQHLSFSVVTGEDRIYAAT